MTLKRWAEVGGVPKKATRKAGKKRKPATAQGGLTITTPDGFRIEVEDPKDLAAVLNALR
jgi:hypothetical protein